MDSITAKQMAEDAGINPKVFREALRKEHFEWHRRYQRWTVPHNSHEHRQMQHVLDRLPRRN